MTFVSSLTSSHAERRTVVVAGAGGLHGIGRATAQVLAENGWSIALIDVNEEGLAVVETGLRTAGHDDVLALPLDISSEPAVAAAYEQIDAALPPVAGLVNLAGIACLTPLHECGLADFERVMAVYVTGSFLMLKASAQRMIPRGHGRIVLTSSITAFDGGGTFSKGVYATAAAAVLGMTRGAARELGPHGITVNALALGPIDTDIFGGRLTVARKASMAESIPLGRVGQPAEVAAATAFLLSEGGGYVNGTTMQIDGGKHMH